MLSGESNSLYEIDKESTIQEASNAIFQNLKMLNLLDTNVFLEIARKIISEEALLKKKEVLRGQSISQEELNSFLITDPACDMLHLVQLNEVVKSSTNASLSVEEAGNSQQDDIEALKRRNQELEQEITKLKHQEDQNETSQRDPKDVETIARLKAQLQQEANRVGDYEAELGSLLSKNKKLKARVAKLATSHPESNDEDASHDRDKDDIIENIDEDNDDEKDEDDESVEEGASKSYYSQLKKENSELTALLEQANAKFQQQSEFNSELSKNYEKLMQETREVHSQFKQAHNQDSNDSEDIDYLKQQLQDFMSENDHLKSQLKSQPNNDTVQLQKIVEQLTQERQDLQDQLRSYEEEDELANQELKQHWKTLEETQQNIASTKRTYEEQLERAQEEKLLVAQELEEAHAQINHLRKALEESENHCNQLQGKIIQLEHEKNELLKQFSANQNVNNIQEFQNRVSGIEKEGQELGRFATLFNNAFQELLKQNYSEFLEVGEDHTKLRLTEIPLEHKLKRMTDCIYRAFEIKDRWNGLLTERNDLQRNLQAALSANASNQTWTQANDQSRNQLSFELKGAIASLEQKQERMKEMGHYIKELEAKISELEYEREDLSKVTNEKNSQVAEIVDMLDFSLEIVFGHEETQLLSVEQKLMEIQNIVKSYQSLKIECRDLYEEKDFLQVTLDSVTNKLKAQQSEIDFLNRQIDIMRTEVASLIKMDEFKNIEKMKNENMKLKQEIENLKRDMSKLENDVQYEKNSNENLKNQVSELNHTVEDLEDTKLKLQKEIKTLSLQVSELTSDNNNIQKQFQDSQFKYEEMTRVLEYERGEMKYRESEVAELQQQNTDLTSRTDKLNSLLEHERDESQKKERNLNDLIQQVSQLIQKNEKANDQLLLEKDRLRKIEDSIAEYQRRNMQLSEQIESLNGQLEGEKRKNAQKDNSLADLKKELDTASHEYEKIKAHYNLDRDELKSKQDSYKELVHQLDEVSSTLR